jgi:hypothetical protein
VRKGLSVVFVLVGVLLLAGCGGTSSSTTTTTELFEMPTRSIRTGPSKPKPRPKPNITVPNVVGQDEHAAQTELAADHLEGHFAPHNLGALVCAAQAPGSTTTSQFPPAGEKVRAGAGVHLSTTAYVQTSRDGCGHASASRACDPSELSVRVTDGFPEFTGGSEVELAGLQVKHAEGGSACNLASTASFQVERDGQPVTGVGGNPMSLDLHAALDSGESMIAGWTIGGWCGSTKGVTATASVDGLTAQGPLTHLRGGRGACPVLDMYSLYKKHD